jgi:uncharacterized protein YndB with AHSA1/START domain
VSRVEAAVEIEAPLAEVWDLYFDPDRWAAWVDGFSSVVSELGYPEHGGVLNWRSTPAGRGEVHERVVAHDPRSLHRTEYVDPGSEGTLETTFEMLPAGEAGRGRRTKITQRLDYRLTSGGPLAAITDLFFIRSQMRQSLQRSLSDLRLEAERTGASDPSGA